MKSKKMNKILSICLVLILAGAALVSGTFAMKSGGLMMLSDNGTGSNASIELIQEQRAGDGFVAYTGDKQLVPVVGCVGTDDEGYPVNANFVDRFVTVQNNGEEALYVRLLVAMPAAFDNPDIADGQDPINIVFEGETGTDDYWNAPTLIASGVMCGSTLSNIYSIEYRGTLSAGGRAGGYAMYGVFVNSGVSNNGNHYTFNNTEIDYDISKGLDLKIKAQGIGASVISEGADPFILMDNNPWNVGGSTTSTYAMNE